MDVAFLYLVLALSALFLYCLYERPRIVIRSVQTVKDVTDQEHEVRTLIRMQLVSGRTEDER